MWGCELYPQKSALINILIKNEIGATVSGEDYQAIDRLRYLISSGSPDYHSLRDRRHVIKHGSI